MGWLKNPVHLLTRTILQPLTYCWPAYRASMNRKMHHDGRFKGTTWLNNLEQFEDAVPDLENKIILDFGCGPLGGIRQRYGEHTVSYDPYVESFQAPPWDEEFDVVFSSDVLEHMTHREIAEFCQKVADSSANYAYLVVSTRAAKKTLPNGINAHLTVQQADWWFHFVLKHLGPEFELTWTDSDDLAANASFCVARKEAYQRFAA